MAKNQQSGSGDGFRFERDVELLLTALMLSDSGFDLWPGEQIVAIRPQCVGDENPKVDDFMITLKGSSRQGGRRVYLQCKETVKLCKTDSGFSKTIHGVYSDYLNRGAEICNEYVMVTGPMARQDYERIDQALINIHERKFSQFIEERKMPQQKRIADFFDLCSNAIKAIDANVIPEEEKLYLALQHFHVLRPDLRERGSFDGSLSDALLQQLFERVQDVDNALRTFYEQKNRVGAEFTKEDVLNAIGQINVVKAESKDNEDEYVEVTIESRIKGFENFDAIRWESDIRRYLLNDRPLSDSFVERQIAAEYAKTLAEGVYGQSKMPYAQQKIWEPIFRRLKKEFIIADWSVWAKAGRYLGMLMEAYPEAFIDRLSNIDDSDLLNLCHGRVGSGGVLVDILYGLSELLSSGHSVHLIFDIVLRIAKIEHLSDNYGEAHRFLEYHLSEDHSPDYFTVEDRLTALRDIFAKNGEIGWTILINLLPTIRTSRLSYACPSMLSGCRKSKGGILIPQNQRKLSVEDRAQMRKGYIAEATSNARVSSSRLSKLISLLGMSSAELFEAIVSTTKSVWMEFDDVARKELYGTLFETWPECVLSTFYRDERETRVQSFYNLICQLFSNDWPSIATILLNVDQFSCSERVRKLQDDAMNHVYKVGGLESVLNCTERVRFKSGAGEVLFRAVGYAASKPVLKFWLTACDELTEDFARSYICHCFRHRRNSDGSFEDEWLWVGSIFDELPHELDQGRFLALLPFTYKVWKYAQFRLGVDGSNAYFCNVRIGIPADKDFRDIGFVVKGLTRHDRVIDAIKLCVYAGFDSGNFDAQDLLEAFESLDPNAYPRNVWSEERHILGRAIEFLQNCSSISRDRISEVEIRLYDQLFDGLYQTVEPKATYDRIMTCGKAFAELLKRNESGAKKILLSCRQLPGFSDGVLVDRGCVAWIKSALAALPGEGDSREFDLKTLAHIIYRLIVQEKRFTDHTSLCEFLETDVVTEILSLINDRKWEWWQPSIHCFDGSVIKMETDEELNSRICKMFSDSNFEKLAKVFA